jgi:hypothetical protein
MAPKTNLIDEHLVETIKKIPLRQRLELLPLLLTGLNLDMVYSKIDKLEVITRGAGYRIIIGEKPVERKVHFKCQDKHPQLKCKIDRNVQVSRWGIKYKYTDDASKVTCLRCISLMKLISVPIVGELSVIEAGPFISELIRDGKSRTFKSKRYEEKNKL